MTLEELKKIIDGITDLPSLPSVIVKVMEVLNNPKSSAQDVKKIIENDYIQTVRILRVANSSYYSFPQKISTVTTAIVLLGFSEIKNLLLSSSVYDFFEKNKGEKQFVFSQTKFLDHSIGVAIAARTIGEFISYDEPEELFVGGLLHDIGKVIMHQFMEEDFEKLIKNVIKTKSLMYKKEKRILGYNHPEVGMMLAKKWKLADKISDMIAYHHRPFLSKNYKREAAIINLADCIARALEIGYAGDDQVPIVTTKVFSLTGLKIRDIKPLMQETEIKFSETKTLFSVKSNL